MVLSKKISDYHYYLLNTEFNDRLKFIATDFFIENVQFVKKHQKNYGIDLIEDKINKFLNIDDKKSNTKQIKTFGKIYNISHTKIESDNKRKSQ